MNRRRAFTASLLLLLLLPLPTAADLWRLQDARLQVRFFPTVLQGLGVTVESSGGAETPLRFVSAPGSVLDLAATAGIYHGVAGGELDFADAELRLTGAGGNAVLDGFRLLPGPRQHTLSLTTPSGRPALLFDQIFGPGLATDGTTTLSGLDLRLTDELARQLGLPQQAGRIVGRADLRAPLSVLLHRGPLGNPLRCNNSAPNYRDPNLDVDLKLIAIDQLACEVCTGNSIDLTPSATLKNVGEADIPWFSRLTGPNIGSDPYLSRVGVFDAHNGFVADGGFVPDYGVQHPYLVWAVYRVAPDGSIEPLGISQVKHAYYTVNTGCDCAPGYILWRFGCEDLYVVGNNSDPEHLAPRSEITAHTGVWNFVSSHFDRNNDRRYDCDPANDPVDNCFSDAESPLHEKLTVTGAELSQPGEYYIETWYVTAGDINIYNSMAHQRFVPSQDNGVWRFDTVGAQQPGPLLNRWVDPNRALSAGARRANAVACSEAGGGEAYPVCDRLTDGDGHYQLAVRINTLDDGRFRYHYALMNLDYDRQLRVFSLPKGPGVALSDFGFQAPRGAPQAAWSKTETGTAVTWTAPAAAALDWGTMITFSFTANAAPVAGQATLTSLEGGVSATLPVLTPPLPNSNPAPVSSITSPPGNVAIALGEGVDFAGTGSDPNNNTPLSFRWDFGASGIADATGAVPGRRVFNRSGVFTVSLTVTDALGASSAPATVTVSVGANRAPDGEIVTPAGELLTIMRGEALQFEGRASDPDGDSVSYRWDFDNSGLADSTAQSPGLQRFLRAGEYKIQMNVSDGRSSDPSPASLRVNVLGRPNCIFTTLKELDPLGDVDDILLLVDDPVNAQVRADVDTANGVPDTTLGLYDLFNPQIMLAVNDDGSAPEEPSGGTDSFLARTDLAAGTYAFPVSAFPDLIPNGRLDAGETGPPASSGPFTLAIGCSAKRCVFVVDDFSETAIALNEVDIYRLDIAGSGLTRVTINTDARSLGSSLDSVVGIADSNNRLVAGNDDGAAPGELPETAQFDSYVATVDLAPGSYTIRVTAYPDYNFNGRVDANEDQRPLSAGPYTMSVGCEAVGATIQFSGFE